MITTTDCLRQILKEKPFIEDMLAQDLLNLSQFAKQIKPEIEQMTMKSIQLGAIVTGLSRLKDEVVGNFEIPFKINDISLKYPLSEIAFQANPEHTKLTSELYQRFSKFQNHFLNIIAGNTETAIFVNSKYEKEVVATFALFEPLVIFNDLAGVSLKFSDEFIYVPGITYSVLRALMWEKINLVEIISTYTEITLIINKQDSQKTFEVLSKRFLD